MEVLPCPSFNGICGNAGSVWPTPFPARLSCALPHGPGQALLPGDSIHRPRCYTDRRCPGDGVIAHAQGSTRPPWSYPTWAATFLPTWQLAALCRDQEPNRGVRLTHPGIARSESAGPSLRVSSPGLPCLRQINRSERDRKCQTSIWRRKAKTARGSLPPAGGHRQRAGDRLPTYPRWPGRVP